MNKLKLKCWMINLPTDGVCLEFMGGVIRPSDVIHYLNVKKGIKYTTTPLKAYILSYVDVKKVEQHLSDYVEQYCELDPDKYRFSNDKRHWSEPQTLLMDLSTEESYRTPYISTDSRFNIHNWIYKKPVERIIRCGDEYEWV